MEGAGAPSARPALILGLGNELISDDGFGPAVAWACRAKLADDPIRRGPVRIETAAAAGFRLLDLLPGYERALIIDVVQTGRHSPGTVMEWPLERASGARTLGGSHQMDLCTTLTFGRSLGYDLPREIVLLVAEAEDLLTVREELTPSVRTAVPRAVSLALQWLDRSETRHSRIGGTMTKPGICPDCQGKGWIELSCTKPDEARVCGLCRGTGVTSLDTQCHGCRGTGRIEVRTVEQQKCLKCEGSGRYPLPEAL